ncbi:MAG TPA: membrane protein insertion efficiency factor YidD [Desulfurivibrionaceae bacterium]
MLGRFFPQKGSAVKKIFIALIRCYQLCISPFFAPSCRFSPTCSQYAIEAFALHGSARGLYLTLRRLLRCHPFHPGGFDPVDRSS